MSLSDVTELWMWCFSHRARDGYMLMCHIYDLFIMRLVFIYLSIAWYSGGYIFTCDCTWRFKSPFSAYKHWFNVVVLHSGSTCPVNTSPAAVPPSSSKCTSGPCLSVFVDFAWKDLKQFIQIETDNREQEDHLSFWSDNAYQDETNNVLTYSTFWEQNQCQHDENEDNFLLLAPSVVSRMACVCTGEERNTKIASVFTKIVSRKH